MPLYNRYQLVQKYLYGEPFEPKTTKKSEEYTEHEYASESDCIKNIIRQWVDDGFVCSLGLKYQKLKEQISTDFGKHWEDSGSTKIGEIMERQSEDCPTLKWGDTNIGDYLLKDKVTNAFVCATMEEIDNGSPLGLEQFTIIGQVTVPPSHGRYGNDKVGSIAYKGVKGCILDNLDIGNNIDSIRCYNANAGFSLKTVSEDDVFYVEIPVYNPERTQYGYEYEFDPDYKIYNNDDGMSPSCGVASYNCLILPYNSDGSINEDFDYPMDGMELSVAANAVINDGITGAYTLYVPSFGEMAYFFPNYTRLTYIRESKLPVNFGNFIMTINQCGWNPNWFLIFDTHCHQIEGTPTCSNIGDSEQNIIYFVQFDGEKFIKPNGVKRWVESDDTMCDGTTKCKTEYEEIFNEGVWSRTGQTRPGEVIETESIDCGFSYPRVALKNLSTGKIEFVDADELGSGQYTTDNYEKFGIEIDTLSYSDGTKAVLRLGTIDCTSVFSNCNGLTVIGSMYIKADTGIANTSVETALTLINGFENTQLVLADGTVDWLNETWTCSEPTSSNGYNRHKYYPFWTAYKNDAYIPSVGEINAIFTKGLKYFKTTMEKLGNTFGSNGFLDNFCTLNGSNVLNTVGTSSISDLPLVCDWSDSSFIEGDYQTMYNWIMFSRVNDDGTILIPTTYAD